MQNITDAQALAFVMGQAYKINQKVYETRYPDWDYGRLIFVDTSGPKWSPGIITYTSDMTGRAAWQAGGAKDIPLADVSQDQTMRSYGMAAIGYEWNMEEINTTLAVQGASLPARRAKAARLGYTKFMWDLTLVGDPRKGMGGLINYPGVVVQDAQADGDGGSTLWVDENGVGKKTPAQIARDVNIALEGVYYGTNEVELADTLLMPNEAYTYISATPYSALQTETILSFIQRTNTYTQKSGRPLTIRTVRELSNGSEDGDLGRLVAYKNDEEYVKLLLPMPHEFLPVWQSGPMHYMVPGVFRTGGVELLTTVAMRYMDKISEPRKVTP